MEPSQPTDAELLRRTPSQPEAFGVLYARHERTVFAFLHRRTGDVDRAADLTAETFAAALLSVRRYRPEAGEAIGWLIGIARNVLGRSLERGGAEDRARRRLGMPRLDLDDGTRETLERLYAHDVVSEVLLLSPDEAHAVDAHVLRDRAYADIAQELATSEAVVRKRVSRGLARMRAHMGERP